MDPISYAKYYAQSLTHYPKYNLINSFFAELRITNDLSFKTTLGINKYFAKDKVFSPSYQYFDSLGQEGGGSVIAERKPEDRYLRISSNDDYAYTVTNLLTYQKSINDVHSVKVLIGHNDEKYKTNAYTAGVSNLPNNDMPMLSFGTERQVVSETATHWALRSYFGRLNYDFKGKYLAEYSIRYDGSSRFSEKNRWGVFPSASVGWRISDENFMKRYKWMDDMKLRASYGVLGNQEIQGLYESYATMDLTSGYDFNNTNNSGVAGSKYANPNIKWEEAHMLNFGLDMTLFDGSLVFNAEYYNKRTKDLILKVNLPTTAGFYTGNSSTFYDNAGEMKNTGFEYSMHYFGGRKGNFKFDILHTGAFNHNEITKLQDGVESYYVDVQYSNMHKVGESYAALTGYKIIGVYQTQEEIDERLKMITERGAVKPGDYIFEDANGDKVIDTKDIVVLGHSQPAYIMGLTANASYKGFDFNIHLQGDIGQQVIARVYGRFNFSYRYWMNNYDYILERWHGPGTSNTMSRVVAGSTINGTHAVSTSEALQPAGYIKIRNVELGYTIPRKISNIAGIQKFRIYCSVANLANFTKYVGFEVERTNTYQRSDVYPQSRTISFGANIEL
ncbi:MAG: SusC/RagA family TonB-linked outer membrane protein [Mangrovibacterium sp.]